VPPTNLIAVSSPCSFDNSLSLSFIVEFIFDKYLYS